MAYGVFKRITGYVGKDTFGRIFIDKCPNNEHHLTQQAIPGKERPGCRFYLDEILDGPVLETMQGVKFDVCLDIDFYPQGDLDAESQG